MEGAVRQMRRDNTRNEVDVFGRVVPLPDEVAVVFAILVIHDDNPSPRAQVCQNSSPGIEFLRTTQNVPDSAQYVHREITLRLHATR